MKNNLVRDVVLAIRDHYDTELTVIVNNKHIEEFLSVANKYSVKTQTISEYDHYIVVIAMKYKNYLKFMKSLQYEHAMNLSDNITISGSTKVGLISELISWKEGAA